MAAITQLTPLALPGRPYGAFTGKPASAPAVTRITQVLAMSLPGRPYGSFEGKPASAPEAAGTGDYITRARRRGRRSGR